jgi:hypothetical protein
MIRRISKFICCWRIRAEETCEYSKQIQDCQRTEAGNSNFVFSQTAQRDPAWTE